MARILRQVTVVRDGNHNAFTDLQFWQGCYWVTYRKGAGHISMDGAVALSVSADRTRFREVAHVHAPGDNRDPKLFPVNENRVALYFPSWVRGYEARELQQYITFSGDGHVWEKPEPILPPGHWLWRVRRHDGRYYGLIQNLTQGQGDEEDPHQLDLAVSENLLDWEIITRVGEEYGLNESDIHWWDDGEAWIVARSATKHFGSCFCSAVPPYTDWKVVELTPMVHAPVFLPVEGELYVAGRNMPAVEGDATFPFKSAGVGLWRVQRGALEAVLRIPATGDCSYPGMVADPQGRVCLSYHSQHAYHMGVLSPPSRVQPHPDNTASLLEAVDVYFAELELADGGEWWAQTHSDPAKTPKPE